MLGKTSTQLGDHKYEYGSGARVKPVQQTQLGNTHTNVHMHTHWLMLCITNTEKATYWTSGPLGRPGLSLKKDDQLY